MVCSDLFFCISGTWLQEFLNLLSWYATLIVVTQIILKFDQGGSSGTVTIDVSGRAHPYVFFTVLHSDTNLSYTSMYLHVVYVPHHYDVYPHKTRLAARVVYLILGGTNIDICCRQQDGSGGLVCSFRDSHSWSVVCICTLVSLRNVSFALLSPWMCFVNISMVLMKSVALTSYSFAQASMHPFDHTLFYHRSYPPAILRHSTPTISRRFVIRHLILVPCSSPGVPPRITNNSMWVVSLFSCIAHINRPKAPSFRRGNARDVLLALPNLRP